MNVGCGATVCGPEQVCIDEVCYDGCETELDCVDPEICVAGGCTTDLCTGMECPEVCHGGSCFAGCEFDTDCAAGDHCYDGRCAADPCEGVSCVDGQFCFEGACSDPCMVDADCAAEETCFGGRCAVEVCDDVQCASTESCHLGACFDTCGTDAECAGGEECFGGTCRVATCEAWTSCVYPDPCATIGERTRECNEEVCDSWGYCSNVDFTDAMTCTREDGCPSTECNPECPGNQICWGGTCFPSGCTQNDGCTTGRCYGFEVEDYYNRCVEDDDPCDGVICTDICDNGGCFEGCLKNSDCPPGIKCFDGRCAESACDFIQCPVEQICRGGKCADTCLTNEECPEEGHKCYAGACKENPCDGFECGEDETCHGETCFADCTEDVHCEGEDEFCISQRCTPSACSGVTCAVDEACYEGGCFVVCTDDSFCDEDHICFDGRCAIDACDDVECLLGWSCYEGSCFPECTDDLQCEEDHYCYDGRCATGACSGVQCPDGASCYEGSCFQLCTTDDQCDEENHFCYEGRCAVNACDGVQCAENMSCYEGSCFKVCTEDDECDEENQYCYEGRCAELACDGVQCSSDLVCYGGTCFATCDETTACEEGHVCYDGRCATDICEGVQCGADWLCFWGDCFPQCDSTSCDVNDDCYSGRCTDDPCESVNCEDGTACYQGSCFQTCTLDDHCDEANHFCFDGRCAPDACHEVDCPDETGCYMGTCFEGCLTDDQCGELNEECESDHCAPDLCADGQCIETCLNLRCAVSPCDGVQCKLGFECVDGTCLDTCGAEGECDPNHHCYKGYCHQESCDEPDAVRCHAGQVCHMGTCFPSCDDDSYCDEDHFCYDGRCATDSCAALVEGYDDPDDDLEDRHLYRRVGNYWPTLRQRSTPTRRPRPIIYSGSWDAALANIVPARSRARVVLYFDETTERYGFVLLQGITDADQGPAGTTYSIRYLDLEDEPEVYMTEASEATRIFKDDDFYHHQVQLQTNGGSAGIGAIAIGFLPGDEEWTIRLSAAFRGDIEAWEFYSAETDTWLDLDLREEIILSNVAMHSSIILSEEVGVRECVPRRGDGSQIEGICARGTIVSCRYGNLECDQSVAPWSFEVCDGRDTNCDGIVDNQEATGDMRVPMVYVRQNSNFDWVRWPTIDGNNQTFDFLNYSAQGGNYGEGSANMMGVDSLGDVYEIQDGSRSLVLFHRDLDRGIISMPLTHGAEVNGSFPSASDVEFTAEFDYITDGDFYDYSDLMFVSWYDDWMPIDWAGEPIDDSYGDDVPMTMKLDEIKMHWEVRQIDVDGSPGREADSAVMQFVWHSPESLNPLRFDLDANLPGSLYEWRLYRPYMALRYLDPGKTLEVKVEWVPISKSLCISDNDDEGCRGVPYVCESGRLACPDASDPDVVCVGCRDRDKDGYYGYEIDECPEGTDCDDDDPNIHPGALEACDGRDTNCDGLVDAVGPPASDWYCPDGRDICGPEECGHRMACSCIGGDCECREGLSEDEYTSGRRASWVQVEEASTASTPGDDGGATWLESEENTQAGGAACSAAPGSSSSPFHLPWLLAVVGLWAVLRRRIPPFPAAGRLTP
ncbi:MAG: putative metal-binding motif-containing protein [Bradymonadaceae bacterium]